ncbi:unnamed protein product [Trichogramma brassicae]|uniref:Uncharacterized protein n=1 Tax=Trichogramma brassicae TaxID=86971 RepID=A0A6H5IY32_9HYME|nr:unnamed protein product [Trichogramma brassicae]
MSEQVAAAAPATNSAPRGCLQIVRGSGGASKDRSGSSAVDRARELSAPRRRAAAGGLQPRARRHLLPRTSSATAATAVAAAEQPTQSSCRYLPQAPSVPRDYPQERRFTQVQKVGIQTRLFALGQVRASVNHTLFADCRNLGPVSRLLRRRGHHSSGLATKSCDNIYCGQKSAAGNYHEQGKLSLHLQLFGARPIDHFSDYYWLFSFSWPSEQQSGLANESQLGQDLYSLGHSQGVSKCRAAVEKCSERQVISYFVPKYLIRRFRLNKSLIFAIAISDDFCDFCFKNKIKYVQRQRPSVTSFVCRSFRSKLVSLLRRLSPRLPRPTNNKGSTTNICPWLQVEYSRTDDEPDTIDEPESDEPSQKRNLPSPRIDADFERELELSELRKKTLNSEVSDL